MRTSPAATMRPSRMTTMPFGIGSEPSPSATVPPVIAMVCGSGGRRGREKQGSNEARIIYVPLAGLAKLEVAHRPLLGIIGIIHFSAVDPHPFGARIIAERIAVPQHDVRHLAGR